MEWLNQIVSIGLVFLLLGATVWLLGRGRLTALGRRRSKPAAAIERVARLQLTPQHSLHVVEFEGRTLLVGTHGSGMTVVEPEAARTRIPRTDEAPLEFTFDRDWL